MRLVLANENKFLGIPLGPKQSFDIDYLAVKVRLLKTMHLARLASAKAGLEFYIQRPSNMNKVNC
jgi:hypothetical protein